MEKRVIKYFKAPEWESHELKSLQGNHQVSPLYKNVILLTHCGSTQFKQFWSLTCEDHGGTYRRQKT